MFPYRFRPSFSDKAKEFYMPLSEYDGDPGNPADPRKILLFALGTLLTSAAGAIGSWSSDLGPALATLFGGVMVAVLALGVVASPIVPKGKALVVFVTLLGSVALGSFLTTVGLAAWKGGTWGWSCVNFFLVVSMVALAGAMAMAGPHLRSAGRS